jgi:hypothetical protein
MKAAVAWRSVTRVMTLPLGTLATLGTSVSLHVLYSFLFSLFIYFLNIYFPQELAELQSAQCAQSAHYQRCQSRDLDSLSRVGGVQTDRQAH